MNSFYKGVEYCGEFEDGQFHGNGTLTYPNGLKIRGVFEKGKMIKWDLQFADGLEYNVPWNYCKMPDRRFYPEILVSFYFIIFFFKKGIFI